MSVIEPKPIASSIYSAVELAPVQRNDPRLIGFIDGIMLLRRHQLLIGLVTMLCTLLSLAVVSIMPHIYIATSTVVLERKDSRPFETEIELKSQDRDRSSTETEMDIIASRLVAGRVVDDLGLLKDPAFNTYLQGLEKGVKSRSVSQQRDKAISTLLSKVSVSRKGESLAIAINVGDSRPELAANVADSLANSYITVSMDFKRKFASKALQFLKQRGSNPLLTALRNEEATLQQTRAELAAKFGDNHPDIKAIDAKIERVRDIITGEFDRMAAELDSETERPSARLLSKAQIPTEPTYPNSNLIVLGTLAGSALLSVILALVLEGLSTTIRNGDQVRQLLQLPNLAYVPIFSKSLRKPKLNPAQEIVMRPQSGFAISMRSLYLACRLPKSDRPHQVIMLSSCLPKEGKSIISTGLAAVAAADGKKTILINLDRDDLSLFSGLKLEANKHSMDDFLSGACRLEDTICQSLDIQGMDVIALSQQSRDKAVQLISDRLSHMIASLRKKYDFIVINTASVLSVDNASWLAPLVDAAILVLSWGKTKEKELWDATSGLKLYQSPLVGTVINDVDPRLQTRYGLGKAVH
jgi:capsular exopolysaccharide synthesis family protein